MRPFAAALFPFLILLCLYQLQRSFGALRYISPIVRYVFIVGSAAVAIQLLRMRTTGSKPFLTRTIIAAIFSSTLSLCLLVLMISWSNGGTQDYSATGGVLPWSDAAGYFEGAERLLFDEHLTGFTERRPLNALFFAARLLVTENNFFGALILQAVFASVGLFLTTSAILETHGKIAALSFFVICFAFVGTCLQRTLSEPLGVTLGLVAFALQWTAIANNRLTPYLIGTFVLTLALLTRAGAMFVLPASVLFAVLFFSDNWRKRVAIALAHLLVISGAWLINLAMIRLYGTSSSGALLSNFSYVLYGLSQGGVGWTKAVAEIQLAGGGGEAEVAMFLYRKAIETILTNPSLLIWGLSKSLFLSMVAFPVHIFRLLADGSDGSAPSALGHVACAAAIMTPAVCIGFFRTVKAQSQQPDRFHSYLLLNLIGFITSLPFFYLDGGIRLTAATFPVTAATIALLFSTFAAREANDRHNAVVQSNNVISYATMAIILVASLYAPKLNRLMNSEPIFADNQCSANEKRLEVRVGRGSAHVNVVSDATDVSFAPNIRKRDFIIPETNERQLEWQSLRPPVTILMGFDSLSKMLVEMVGPPGFADGPPRLASLCAIPLNNTPFSHQVTQW
jgi:hypothetical protein